MADITISDLELAPALTDDMVLPVENTTDTYAATLAMLRRLINKTFVEVENADFNALTDDGFYQCTGTPTNSPVAGAINWTLQVSAENGVVVQRAFSLDDNFANVYIRRWNSVTWTGWLEVGAGALDNKANISLSNLDATGQEKFDAKADTSLSNLNATGQAKLGGKTPNYSAGVGIGSGYTAPSAGVIVGVHNFSDGGYRSIDINGVTLFNTKTGASYLNSQSAGHEYIVGKGDVITFSNYASMVFYPFK